ncbi:MAG: DUF3179 domain-containing (seleno)protein [Nannocystaceae bacterium]
MVCHSGVGLTPTVDGKIHHFSAGGLYNGLVLLIDDETRSYWDHVTGEAVHGPLRGATLDAWHTPITDVATALADDPGLAYSRSRMPLRGRLIAALFGGHWQRRKGMMPGFFRKTMGAADERLPEHTQGLGVVVDGEARFYPKARIAGGVADRWGERVLRVGVDPRDGIPRAAWADGGAPMQLFARWYGFAYTYPGCGLFGG